MSSIAEEVILHVGEKEYSLKLDVNSICLIEEKLDIGVFNIIPKLCTNFLFSRAFLWGALQYWNSNITLIQAGALIKKVGLKKITPLLFKLIKKNSLDEINNKNFEFLSSEQLKNIKNFDFHKLLEMALASGLSQKEFEEMTPKEVQLHIKFFNSL